MVDLNKLSPQARKAAMEGGTSSWGHWGNQDIHKRYMEPIKSRRKCHCGCGKRETHIGMCNGVGLTSGCAWAMNVWVREGTIGLLRLMRRQKEQSE
ncbi:hypothetical protein [Brucella sp.]|uniref:hypothetical protein n=1 Tax=Brucella sp. TaxID=52132 RepID=UPI0028AB26B5|nr:hypothetical protein [Brucella sp.]